MCDLISESTITFDNIRMFWQKVKLYRTTQVMPGPQTRDHRDLLRRTVRDSLPKPDVKVVVEERHFDDQRHHAGRHVDVGP